MKSIELNDTNWFARYHNFIYGYLPDNFCEFFWRLLPAILLFPLVVPSEIQNNYLNDGRSDRPFFAKIFLSAIIYFGLFLLTGLGIQTLEKMWGQDVVNGWDLGGWLILLSLSCGILVVSLIIFFIALVLGGCSYIHEEIKHRRYKKKFRVAQTIPQGPSQLRLMIDNIRSKYCTKIVWKTKDVEME